MQYLINITFSKEFNDKFFEHEIRRRRQVDDTYKATEERLNELIGRVRVAKKKKFFKIYF